MIVNVVTGLIGIALVTLFLGFMAIKIASVPLGILILIVLAFAIFDFLRTVLSYRNKTEN